MNQLVLQEKIERKIFLIRGKKVMLDSNLAELYRVQTKALIQAVKRNIERFPPDFMFILSNKEHKLLRSQIVTSNIGRGGRRYLPYAFTEQGVAMLSSILSSKRAIRVNIQIMRTFTRLREIITSNRKIRQKLTQLEKRINKNDNEISSIFEAIRQLTAIPEKPKRKVGFYIN